jgi:flavin reductase (DIM6/NTAB) family NADH-FMN oxidoreductase RutF
MSAVNVGGDSRHCAASSRCDGGATSRVNLVTAFDSARFRQVMGHFPTGVTVVTALDDTHPVGFTIGSFTSVSLEPLLVGFLPQTSSETWPAIERSGRFCVNVLGVDHGELCWRFAKSGDSTERFEGVHWHSGPSGSPVLDDAIAWLDCSIEATYEMGDHVFVLGRVMSLDHTSDDHVDPLLFFRGKLGGFRLLGG